MDWITDLPKSEGYDSILVVVDHRSTKGVIFHPCISKGQMAIKTAQILLDTVYRRFGLPESIISDRDPKLTSKVFQEMMKLLQVKWKGPTAYHPQTNGETERINQE